MPVWATAQDAVADQPAAETAPPTAPTTDAAITRTIPRLTAIVVELLATLSSETSANGDRFPLRLAQPIMIDGLTVVAAGTMGEGEVVHAKPKGGMGAAGELILTARFLQLEGQQIPLRSMRVGGGGPDSRIDTVNSLGVASAATLPLVALVGFFIEGGAMSVAEGARATARTAQDVAVPLVAAPTALTGDQPAPAVPVEQQQQSNLEGESE